MNINGGGSVTSTDGYLGVAFQNENTGVLNYGYIHMTTSGPDGFPAHVFEYGYDNSGAAITIPFRVSETASTDDVLCRKSAY